MEKEEVKRTRGGEGLELKRALESPREIKLQGTGKREEGSEGHRLPSGLCPIIRKRDNQINSEL